MVEHYQKLVELVARAFYDDITCKGNNQTKSNKNDNKGIAVVVLDALARRQWVREEDLAMKLQLQPKLLRRILQFFEEQKFILRDHMKERKRDAVAATTDGQQTTKEREKVKLHTYSYCCLDYQHIVDVVRLRLFNMKKKLKDELEEKTVQEYLCPNCGKSYNVLDALRLVSFEDEYFHCESCNGKLEVKCDKLGGDGDDNGRRRRKMLKDMLQNMEVQLKPLMDQLNRVKDLPVPYFGSTLQEWEAQARARANGDSKIISQGLGYGGTTTPYSGDTKVVVDFNDNKSVPESTCESTSVKVMPPWMIKQGMTLTKQERGEVKQETKMDDEASTSTAPQYSDDRKSTVDQKSLQDEDEYIKAYYAALFKRQQEMEEAAKAQEQLSNKPISVDPFSSNTHRQVGMKSKYDDEDNEETEWEEAPISGNAGENYKVHSLNVEANAQANDDEDDDVEWEEN